VVTVVLDLSRLACSVGSDEAGPVLLLVDGSTRVELRVGSDPVAAFEAVQRLISEAARLGRKLAS
jgi:hypothetical protein